MQRSVHLPTGPHPGWELDISETNPDAEELNLPSESLVVLQSLRHSRNKWVTAMFQKFSTKARGSKATENAPPPHTIKAHGKCDLRIGPHVFSSTAIYEVHYLPSVEPPNAHESQSRPYAPSADIAVPSPQSHATSQTFPSLSYVTPALSSKVAIAAQSNPILANLLNAVMNRTATDDQVKTLGLLIQSLEGVQQLENANNTQPTDPHVPAPRAGSPKPFDIVLEFHERPSDRWILPRGDAYCERVGVADGAFARYSDVIVTMCLTAPSATGAGLSAVNESSQDSPPEVTSFRLSRVPQQLWDLFLSWAGGAEKMNENRAKLANKVRNEAPRSYLQYRVPEGELLTELQNATAPLYTLKSIKPAGADSNRAKRKTISRKPTLVSDLSSTPAERSAPAKRRQSLKAKASAPPPIACHACGQRDVPLMMGGRYCRACIDAGRAVTDIPQTPLSKASHDNSIPQTSIFVAGVEATLQTDSSANQPVRGIVQTPTQS